MNPATHTAPVGLYHRPWKHPKLPKMPCVETEDEVGDLRVIVAWAGLRPLRRRRRHQYLKLARAGVI
jgi:hypothetical protein